MAPSATSPSVRDRIQAVASDLFYRQGFRATGINQIIDESGVAKASFYDHFRSKDALLVECIRETSRREIADIRRDVGALPTPRDRFFGPMRMLVPWLESSGYRGCPFQNILAETPADDGRVQTIARDHRENIRNYLSELTRDLVHADPTLAHLDVDRVVDTYLLLFEGAIAASVAYRQPWPADRAVAALESLLQTK